MAKLYKFGDKIFRIPPLTPDKIESNNIRVISGKREKDRVVPLPSKLFLKAGISREKLLKYLPLRISRRGFQQFFQKLSKEVLKKNVSVHTLRHGFCQHALESGIDIHEVQRLAGHSRLDVTGLYLHANPKRALDKYEEVF